MEELLFPVCEVFTSINGEAQNAGELACFIRFAGCNLRCSYCDTKWANDPEVPVQRLGIAALCNMAQESGARNVTLTGGEPLLQKDLGMLTEALGTSGFRVEIETNGSMPAQALAALPHRPCFTFDYKLPSSGMEAHMRTENYALLTMADTVKLVCGCREDLERAAAVIAEHRLTERCKVYLSPVFGKIEPREMVEFMKEHKLSGVRLQLQLHKFIWPPEERGV